MHNYKQQKEQLIIKFNQTKITNKKNQKNMTDVDDMDDDSSDEDSLYRDDQK